MQARYYDPVIGRFYSNDPVGMTNVHTFNRYTYANNNPYKYVDPDGESAALAACVAGPIGCAIGVGITIYAVYHGVEGTRKALENNQSMTGSPMPDGGGPDDDDDNYENPGHHDPSGKGPNRYNSTKAILPKNHKKLFKNSKKVGKNRWTKEGKGKKAVYHRFSSDGNGKYHWSGSTNGKNHKGVPRKIKDKDVPKEVKK
jgi:uncharacterized protein RhaS with RHS repeats